MDETQKLDARGYTRILLGSFKCLEAFFNRGRL